MITVATVAMLAAMFAWGFSRRMAETARDRAGRLYTFIVDPPTMLVAGLVAVLAGLMTRKGRKLAYAEFTRRRRLIDVLLLVFLLGFWTFELLTYFDVLRHPYDPSRTGNDFMWNGYVEWITGPVFHWTHPTYHYWWSWPLLAVMLVAQYACLRFGRALGYMTAYFNDMDRWSRRK